MAVPKIKSLWKNCSQQLKCKKREREMMHNKLLREHSDSKTLSWGKRANIEPNSILFLVQEQHSKCKHALFLNQTKSHFLQSETFYRNPNEPLAWAPVAPVRFTGPRRVNEPIGTTMFREENHLDHKRFSKLYSSAWRPTPLCEYRGFVNNSVMLCYTVGTLLEIN